MISCFEIFSIAPTFDLDLAKLEAEYFKAQRQYHPDKFIGKTEQEKMTALQYSMDINQAYKILKNPLKRAQHLLQLQGIIVGSDADSVKPSNDLLMEIMELREHLDEERDTEKYIKLVDQLNNLHKNSLLDILKYYANKDWQKMAQEVLRLGYLLKMLDERKQKKL